MEYKEAWAVDIARIERFFLSRENAERGNVESWDAESVDAEHGAAKHGDAESGGEVLIRCGACKVKLSPLPLHPVGPVAVPRTLVEISGPDGDAGELYRRFFLHFISAGG